MSPPPPRYSVPPGYEFGSVVDVTDIGREPGKPQGVGDVSGLAWAISDARDIGAVCFLTEHGRRIAAIVPVRAEDEVP